MAGFISGLGAATADALYGSIAGFGLTIVSSFLISQSHWFQLAGGIFLLYLGIKTFLAKPKETIDNGSPLEKGRGVIWNYVSTFFLTLTNPLTILSFMAIFAGLGLGTNASVDFPSATVLVVGVFSGSAAWWFFLSSFTGLIRGKINRRTLVWVNRVSAMSIFGFGLIALVGFV
jgi:threonine/homoserine/homoserine lactone efflux protein